MILCKYSHDQTSRSPNTSVAPLVPTLTFKSPLEPRQRALVQRWRGGGATREEEDVRIHQIYDTQAAAECADDRQ